MNGTFTPSVLTNFSVQEVQYTVTRKVLANVSITAFNVTDDDDYEYYYYEELYRVDAVISDWQSVILGYVYFILSLLTIVINCLVFLVFIWKKIRVPTSVILLALAVSNTVICVTILPSSLYLYIQGHYRDRYLLYSWCVVRHVCYIAHQMSRTSSNWLVALLGIQRSIIVVFPFQAKRYCSMKNTVISTCSTFIISFAIFICEALAVQIKPQKVYSTEDLSILPDGCSRDLTEWFGKTAVSVMTNYIVTTVFSRLLPCIVLLLTTILLTVKLWCKEQTTSDGLQSAPLTEKRFKRATLMIFIILFLFLLSELQDVIAFFIYVHELSVNKIRSVLSKEADRKWATIGVVIWLLVYNIISWVFFFMSRQFREAFYNMYLSNVRAYNEHNTTRTTMLKSSSSSPRTFKRSGVKNSRHPIPETRKFVEQ